ncbi:hypothetical protein SUGI_0651710 [Cryptomeria japonica]|nr:hypothetical protein SUGI_0651710 [Cryptomeria japonica]
MNTMLYRKLFVVIAAPMNFNLCCKLFAIHSFHFRNVFSTESHSQTLFSQFASSKLNLSEVDITRMLKLTPNVQKLRTFNNAEEVIHSFKKRGFTEAQIASIVRVRPRLFLSSESGLESKIKLLEDFGFGDRNLLRLLRRNTSILNISLKNGLLPKMEFLKNVYQSQDVLVKSLLKAPRLLCMSLEKTLKPSLAFWEGLGFPGMGCGSLLRVYPGVLSRTSLTPGQVDLINKIGADKERNMFRYIVGLVAMGRVETLEAKIENRKLCGLSAEETWQLLGGSPLF